MAAASPWLSRVEIDRKTDRVLTDRPALIGDGGNSGFQALNLAIQFGAARVLLVAFDMRLDRGVHWHGKHGCGLNNPHEKNLPRWRASLNGAAEAAARLGVTVINCSPISALTAFPVMSLEEALECCD